MTTTLAIINLYETSSRRIYRAKCNGQELGEFHGYGETEQDMRESAMKQASAMLQANMAGDFVKRMNKAGLRKQFFDDHLGKMVDFKY